ncbi:MAG: signal recognition particle receptor subunit alpha, partial [Clostridia bacterium]|nr:signal recognition particle receptor subunit alpha [Clostridia bacterium]
EGKITEVNISEAMKDIRRALLDADVSYKIAKQFCDDVKKKQRGRDHGRSHGYHGCRRFHERHDVRGHLRSIHGCDYCPYDGCHDRCDDHRRSDDRCDHCRRHHRRGRPHHERPGRPRRRRQLRTSRSQFSLIDQKGTTRACFSSL